MSKLVILLPIQEPTERKNTKVKLKCIETSAWLLIKLSNITLGPWQMVFFNISLLNEMLPSPSHGPVKADKESSVIDLWWRSV